MKLNTLLPLSLAIAGTLAITACTTTTSQPTSTSVSETASMTKSALTNEQKAVALLESLETGDMTPVSYINPNKYIQHNLMVGDGLAGFGEVMKHKPPQGFKAEVIRSFTDGDYVFTQTKYDFFGDKVGFDIFRFEDGLIVEHWDNLEDWSDTVTQGNTQINGATQVTDLDKTDANKVVVSNFINDVFINRKRETFSQYLDINNYRQHHVGVKNGLQGLKEFRQYRADNNITMSFSKLHGVFGEGNFVLSVTEGKYGANGGKPVAFYDLFRLENGKIVEHWDTIQEIPPRSEWKNDNGKFGF